MKGLVAACVALGLSAAIYSGSAAAQARGESVQDFAERMNLEIGSSYVTSMSDLDAWLRRLHGHFRVFPGGGTRVDCTSVGTGPGVECKTGPAAAGATDVAPSFTLFGVDPDLPGIRRFQVGGDSIAFHDEGARLRSDDKLIFSAPCPVAVHTPPPTSRKAPTPIRCYHQVRILASPDGQSVDFRIYTERASIVPKPDPPTDGGMSRPYNPIQTTTIIQTFEWRRIPDDEPIEPVLKLESKELEALEQYGKMDFPPLVGNLFDQAGILAPAQRTDLESRLVAYEAETSQQIVVVTVDHLGSQTIEEFSRQALQTWQLGSDERTSYILVVVAPNDGGVRIEPGAALSACVPDITALQIMDEAMIPDFTYRRFGEGISKGVAALMTACRDWQAEEEEP